MKNKKKTDVLSAQELYLKTHRRHHHSITCMRLILLLSFLTVWELCADFHIIDSFFFSSPSMVLSCFVSMLADHSLFLHIGVTLFETIISLLW